MFWLHRPARLLFALLLLALCPLTARAAMLLVSNSNDGGPGSLRAVVAAASAGDTVTFAPAVTHIVLTSGQITIGQAITIYGPGVAVDGNQQSTVFQNNAGTAAQPVALVGLTVENGSTSGNGGGVSNGNTITLIGCTLAGNYAQFDGGGFYNSGGSATLTACIVSGNNSGGGSGSGGGLMVYSGLVTLNSCLVTGNTAPAGNGGGLFSQGRLVVNGCTFTANSSPAASLGGVATLTDDILYNDTGAEVGLDGGTVTTSHCDIQGNSATPDANGNFGANPKFFNGAHLQSGSPCIGAGASVPGLTYDIAGVPRFAPPSIGAYEYVAQSLVVSNTNDTGNGSLRNAVQYADATPYTVITFDPVVFQTPQTIALTSGSLNISTPTAILGPAAGVAVDGSSSGGGVIFFVTSGLSAVNLTIQHGGGGILSRGTVTLTDCALLANSNTGSDGGGIDNQGTLTLTGCAFTGNSASSGGGLDNGGPATLVDCVFSGNSASEGEGGGVENSSSALTLSDCVFTGNSAMFGGGLENDYAGTATVTNCTFTGNSASANGGALYDYLNGATTLTDDILSGDTASGAGGEIFVYPGGTVTASYCDINGAISGTVTQTNPVTGDPKFVTPYTNSTTPFDLHLQSGSPSAGTGTTSAPNNSYLPYDLDGRPRPMPSNANPSLGAFEAAPNGAYSLQVENTSDSLPQSLRADVQCADDYPDAQITFDPAVFTTPLTITETTGTITLSQPMTITAPAPGIAIDGHHSSLVIEVHAGKSSDPVALTGLTIQNGSNSSDGGGLYNEDSTTILTGCTLMGNSAGFGGGLYNNYSVLTLTDCLVTGNSAGNGGGLYNNGAATLTVTGGTSSGNSAAMGGALFNASSGPTTLTDDLFWGDTATVTGREEHVASGTVTPSYCDIQGDTGDAGTNGNLNVNPLFVGAGSAPYAVLPGSPVVGAGIAATGNAQDITGATRANPPTIGAYEGTAASTSTSVAVAAGTTNPSAYGTPVTFTATVGNISDNLTPTGSVTFSLDSGTPTAPVALNSSGQASFTPPTLAVGPHTVGASFLGNARFAASAGSLAGGQTVNADATTTVLSLATGSSATVTTGTNVSFSATVANSSVPGVTPAGSVQLYVGLGNAAPTAVGSPIALSSGAATLSYTFANPGTYKVYAVYVPDASGDFTGSDSSAAPLTEIVSAPVTSAPPTIVLSIYSGPSTVPLGSTVPLVATANSPSGTIASVKFYINGTLFATGVNRPFTVNVIPGTAGTYAFTAVATDSNGQTTLSNTVYLTFTTPALNIPPTIVLSIYSGPSTLPVASAVPLLATANDPDGTVVSVKFYIGTFLFATGVNRPYSVNARPGVAGTYTFTAVATDNSGASTTSNPVVVTFK